MTNRLRKLWQDYNLSLVLLACFISSWCLHAWTGWRKFSSEQFQQQQTPALFGGDGYVWEFLSATFENWQSEFLQLLAMVVLTSFLVHRGSAESRDSSDRMEAKIDALHARLDKLVSERGTQPVAEGGAKSPRRGS